MLGPSFFPPRANQTPALLRPPPARLCPPRPPQVRKLFQRAYVVGRAFPICHVRQEGVLIEVRAQSALVVVWAGLVARVGAGGMPLEERSQGPGKRPACCQLHSELCWPVSLHFWWCRRSPLSPPMPTPVAFRKMPPLSWRGGTAAGWAARQVEHERGPQQSQQGAAACLGCSPLALACRCCCGAVGGSRAAKSSFLLHSGKQAGPDPTGAAATDCSRQRCRAGTPRRS